MIAFMYELLQRIESRKRVSVYVPVTDCTVMWPKDQMRMVKSRLENSS